MCLRACLYIYIYIFKSILYDTNAGDVYEAKVPA
jgi:hypothetical protein